MLPDPPTRLLTDLARGHEGDGMGETAWREFDGRYRAALMAFAQRLGVDRADAEEIAQDALVAFAMACRAGTVDPTAGTLAGWLFALVRDRVRNHWRQNAARRIERGASALAEIEDDARLSVLWDAEWRSAMLREGLRRLREESGLGDHTLAAFDGMVLDGRGAAAIGEELGLSVNAVYQAKFRASERLRSIIAALERADHMEAP